MKRMYFRLLFRETTLDDLIEGYKLVLSWLTPRDENGKVIKSLLPPSRPGRLPILFKSPFFRWACTDATACLTSEEVERDFWSIISDILLFFKMGFFWINEFDLDSLALFGLVDVWFTLDAPACNGL